MKKECIAMLLAGGQGSRLYVLTGDMAKPAVPFGGKYRIIDFPLSNCTNSGIDTVGVLTQYRPLELNSYIGSGQPWDLDDPDYVVVLSGDHIYKMDYSDMLARHKAAGAACTISVMEVPWAEAPRFGIMSVDGDDMITEFAEKPKEPKSNLASMGIYVFSWKALRQYLIADEADPNSSNDFGKNIIPNMLNAGGKLWPYRFEGYWKDVGTLESLWDANMDMLAPESGLDLRDQSWPIYARSISAPPAFLGANSTVTHSAVNRGSVLEGVVENSVLSPNVTVGEGATVRYSVLFPGVVVEPGAVVEYAILGEGCKIGRGCHVGGTPENTPEGWGLTVLAPGCELPEGRNAKAGIMLSRNGEEVSK